MGEENKKTNTDNTAAEDLRAAITDRGEKTLAEIITALRASNSAPAERCDGLSESAAVQPAQKGDQGARRGVANRSSENFGVQTFEYNTPPMVRSFENAIGLSEGMRKAGPGLESRINTQTEVQNGAALKGKSRAIQLDIIRRLSDEAAEELPERLYEKLSGGIALSEAKKYHPKSRDERPLLILGEYRNDPRLGRSIMLYGGSIIETYASLSEHALKNELRRIIRHEFTHHIESLCGERGLEIEDELSLERYEWELRRDASIAPATDSDEDVR